MTRARAGRVLVAALATVAVLGACEGPAPMPPVTDGDAPTKGGVHPFVPPAGPVVDRADVHGAGTITRGEDGGASMPMLEGAGAITWRVIGDDGAVLDGDAAERVVSFPDQEDYSDIHGVLAWRGGPWRTGGTSGERSLAGRSLEVAWQQPIGALSSMGATWDGAGWTGQPVVVDWPAATDAHLPGIRDGGAEVLYPTFDGGVHRFDLATGTVTAPPLLTGQGFKGSASLDPRGYPLLYAGQGLPASLDPASYDMRFTMLDLVRGSEIASIRRDPVSDRRWQAFDSSALVDADEDVLVTAGENGVLYRVELGSSYDDGSGAVALSPRVTRLVYRTPSTDKIGVESSITAYRNLVWFSDNDRNLLCVDVARMEVVWARDVGDDADVTMPLEITDEGMYLYHANEVDHRGGAAGEVHPANLRKIDALTGEVVWQVDVDTSYDAGSNGGVLASPMLGRGDLAGTVLFNVARTTTKDSGTLLALDTSSGERRWSRDLEHLSWSTPTQVDGADGTSLVLLGDAAGVMHLVDPSTGQDASSLQLDGTIEATPAVVGDMAVVATRARTVYGLRLG